MNNEEKYNYIGEYIVKVLSICKIGQLFSKDEYALKNYKELEHLSMDMLNKLTNLKIDRPNYFSRDVYPTPNVSCRCLIIKDNKLLLVKEIKEQAYSIPGGWCDLYESPSESITRECIEEAGVRVKNIKLVGILTRFPTNEIEASKNVNCVSEYQLIFKADIDSIYQSDGLETDDVNFFSLNDLPKLSNKLSKRNWDIVLKNINSDEIYCD